MSGSVCGHAWPCVAMHGRAWPCMDATMLGEGIGKEGKCFRKKGPMRAKSCQKASKIKDLAPKWLPK